jgi:tyrosyl-tRNA synthetase
MNGFEVLKERGFVQQCSDEQALRKAMDDGQVTLYVGFDPTGSSLHVGHMVSLQAMAHLQRAGHRPIALVGGGTARIGDPSGKTETRKMLSIDEIKSNAQAFKKQIGGFLDFAGDRALMVDNADWLAGLNYIEFLRDIGRHFSVNKMLTFETYKMRLETGLSFIEFNYQLLQSYDYLELHRRHDCRLQVGGDDQWGNIVSGIELIRRVERAETFALTTPLITTADGKKMGKTEKGALYLDPAVVSPYEFYQYWINVADGDVRRFLLLYTFLPVEQVAQLTTEGGQALNKAKESLAWEVTRTVHGQAEADKARDAARAAFGGSGTLEGVPSMAVGAGEVAAGISVLDLLTRSGLCASRGEARRLLQQGGAYVNEQVIGDIEAVIGQRDVRDGTIRLRAGKKRYFVVRVE